MRPLFPVVVSEDVPPGEVVLLSAERGEAVRIRPVEGGAELVRQVIGPERARAVLRRIEWTVVFDHESILKL